MNAAWWSHGVAVALLAMATVPTLHAQPRIDPGDLPPTRPEPLGWNLTELVSRQSSVHSFNPDLAAAPDGQIYVAWVEAGTTPPVMNLLVAQRPGGYGRSWSSATVAVTATPEASWFEKPCPSLAADNSLRVHMAWNVDRTDGAGGIYVSQRDPNTGAWSSATQVSSGQPRGCPTLAAGANGQLHLVWAQREGVYYRAFDPALNAWLETLRLSETNDTRWFATVGTGPDGSMHVAWVASGNSLNSALYYRSRHPGLPWTAVQTIATAQPPTQCPGSSYRDGPADHNPAVAQGTDGTVHLAWTQRVCRVISVNHTPESHIFYKRYTPSAGWSAAEEISAPRPQGLADQQSTDPRIEIARGWGRIGLPPSWVTAESVHVLWRELTHVWTRGNANRIVYRSLDASAPQAWSELVEVQKFDRSVQPGQSAEPEFSRPALAVDGDAFGGVRVHAAWAYLTDLLNSGPDIDVFYRRKLHAQPRAQLGVRPGVLPVEPPAPAASR